MKRRGRNTAQNPEAANQMFLCHLNLQGPSDWHSPFNICFYLYMTYFVFNDTGVFMYIAEYCKYCRVIFFFVNMVQLYYKMSFLEQIHETSGISTLWKNDNVSSAHFLTELVFHAEKLCIHYWHQNSLNLKSLQVCVLQYRFLKLLFSGMFETVFSTEVETEH